MGMFTNLADFFVYSVFHLSKSWQYTESIHFFIEDITKIFTLLVLIIYLISFARYNLDLDSIKNYLKDKNKFIGYFLAAILGAITPFCSCSSIPLFIGFTNARIPVGITMSFLVTSPILNEVALVMLASIFGLKFGVIYFIIGVFFGVISGIFFDLIKAEKYLLYPTKKEESVLKVYKKTTFIENIYLRNKFAIVEMRNIFLKVWKFILIGVGLGAFLHGFVPSDFILKYIGNGAFSKFASVPIAVILGLPLYSNSIGFIPIAKALIEKGLPFGTTIAFMLATVGASFPEFIMLKQIMRTKLLFIFFALLLFLFTLTGWIFNFIY